MTTGASAVFGPPAHSWPVTLRHGGLVMRPIRARDRRQWDEVRRRNWDWLRTWEPTPPPLAAEGPKSFAQLARMLNQQARETRCLPWVLAWEPPAGERFDGVAAAKVPLIGQLTVSGISLGSARWGQIGYWIDERFAGRGLMPLAVALACDYCFTVLRLHRLEIAIRPENVKSLRVVEKLGLREEGPRPRYLHIDGDWRDHRVFAVTPEEVPGGVLARLGDTPPAVRASGGWRP